MKPVPYLSERIKKNTERNVAVLVERLNNGWEYLQQHPEDREAEDLWFDLLRQYEIGWDLLQGSKRREWKP